MDARRTVIDRVGLIREAKGTSHQLANRISLLYVHLWVLEGAARKWIPGLDAILYVARDALLIAAIIFFGIIKLRGRRSGWWFWSLSLFLAVLAGIQVIAGVTSLQVAIVGMRSYVAPLLLIYVVWRYQVQVAERAARIISYYAVLELLIIVLQVISPANAAVNLQIGGEEAHFINSGVVRASGTFSSPAGLTLFLSLAAATSVYLVAGSAPRGRRAAWFALMCTVLGVALAGSRGAVLAVALVLAFFVWYAVSGQVRGGVAKVITLSILVALLGGAASIAFSNVVDSFLTRFEMASQQEDSNARLLSQAFGFLSYPVSPLGEGIGARSQAGISAGSGLQWLEIESEKWVGELGFSGLVLVMMKLTVVGGYLVSLVWQPSRHDLLRVMAAGALFPVLLWGQVTQFPTAQGFVGISLMLMFAPRLGSDRNGPRPRHTDQPVLAERSII